jgi:hypothetical protein
VVQVAEDDKTDVLVVVDVVLERLLALLDPLKMDEMVLEITFEVLVWELPPSVVGFEVPQNIDDSSGAISPHAVKNNTNASTIDLALVLI